MEKDGIVQSGHPALRDISRELTLDEIHSTKIQKTIEKMKKVLETQDDGVALAAPQIGETLRIFVVSGKVFDMQKGVDIDSKDYKKSPDQVFINPKLSKLSKKRELMEEGCLSVRYLYGKIERSEKATIDALDEKGNKVTRGATGLLAQIFQHETDHLDGKLFIDRAVDLVDLPPKKTDKK